MLCQYQECKNDANYIVLFNGRFGKQKMCICKGHELVYDIVKKDRGEDLALEFLATSEMTYRRDVIEDVEDEVAKERDYNIDCPDITFERLPDNMCKVVVEQEDTSGCKACSD